MLIRSLTKDTLSLQGFRVKFIDRYHFGIGVKIVPDQRYKPRCGQCGCLGQCRDTRAERHFKHVPLWGIPVMLNYSPRRVLCRHCKGIYVERIPWAAGIVKTPVEETTFINYRKVMNCHVLPQFGNRPIDSIMSLDIETFISKLKCGGKTKQNILTPFRLVMKFAKKHKIIQSNPFVDVDPIKRTKSKQKRPLTLEEISRFIDALDPYWQPLFIFMFFTGVRIAEAAGLKWKRVDFKNRIILIHRSLVRAWSGKIIYKKPKTESYIISNNPFQIANQIGNTVTRSMAHPSIFFEIHNIPQ